jgi:hypothetical protein
MFEGANTMHGGGTVLLGERWCGELNCFLYFCYTYSNWLIKKGHA